MNNSQRLDKVEADLQDIKSLVLEVRTGFRWFIRGAKFTAALGLCVMALKGVVSWSDVRDAFKGIA